MDENKITNGEDISLDNGNVIVLNNISVAEKVSEEVKKEVEEPKVETPAVEAKEAPEITPVVDATSVETPATTIAVPTIDEPIIPTIDNVVPKEFEFPNNAPISITNEASPDMQIPTVPETQFSSVSGDASLNTSPANALNESLYSKPAFNTDPNYNVNEGSFNSDINNFNSGIFGTNASSPSSIDYSNNSFNKFDNYNNTSFKENNYAESGAIPEDVETAFSILRSTIGKVAVLETEKNRLNLENDDLKRQLNSKEEEVKNLKANIKNMENQVKTMQARVLDMFGMGNIKQNTDNYYGQDVSNMNPHGQNSYNDDSSNIRKMAA